MDVNTKIKLIEAGPLDAPIVSASDLGLVPTCACCADPRRAQIDAVLGDPRCSLKDAAEQFGFYKAQLKQHLPHIENGAKILARIDEPAIAIQARLRGRSNSLQDAAQKSISVGDFAAAAKLAEVMFKYDQLLVRIKLPSTFPSANTTPINAPGSQFAIMTGPPSTPDTQDNRT